MADSMVPNLLENISQLLKQEPATLLGAGDEIQSLHTHFVFINQHLPRIRREGDKLKDLLSSINDVVQEAHDAVDTFVIQMAKNKRRSTFAKFQHGMTYLSYFPAVVNKAESIRNQIEAMPAYQIQDDDEPPNDDPDDDDLQNEELNKIRQRVAEEDDVVGFDRDVDEVRKMLFKSNRSPEVISIVGMAGLGKTTLAKKVYNHNLVRTRFLCRAWIHVTQHFKIKSLLLSILKCVAKSTEGMYEMTEDQLAIQMRKCLEGKRYLIVLDDVWTTKVWAEAKKYFPDNKDGCKILVTSRVTKVAVQAGRSRPYLLRPLKEEDGWKLFSKLAFNGEDCPPKHKIEGEKIVVKCKGLPLALTEVGRRIWALKEKSNLVWSQVADDVNKYLIENQDQCVEILALSYDNLPSRLKPCFLYFGVFPCNVNITARQLIRLWISEGFVEQDSNKKPEDVAEDYLEELFNYNLITVARRRCDGGVKSFFIHDLLHNFCIFQGIKEKFFVVCTEGVFTSTSSSTTIHKPLRLSIHCSTSRYFPVAPFDSSRVRTLLCFSPEPGNRSNKMFHSLCKEFRLLKVLDLGSTSFISIPTQVENLVHLRYLRMNAPQIDEIPTSISNIPNIQTLDLRESRIKYLTLNIWSMQSLRHLFLSGACDMPTSLRKQDIKTRPQLQTLSCVSSDAAYLLDLGTIFPNLRKLGIQVSRYSKSWGGSARQSFSSVRTLKLMEEYRFNPGNGPLSSLTTSSNLTKLTLIRTKIRLPVLEVIAKLPKLKILKLMNKSLWEDVSMECGEGWFPSLEVLHMVDLNLSRWTFEEVEQPEVVAQPEVEKLEKEMMVVKSKSPLQRVLQKKDGWVQPEFRFEIKRLEREILLSSSAGRNEKNLKVMTNAMQSLRNLLIFNCKNLVEIPEGLKKVTSLRNVKASSCNFELESKLCKLGDNIHYEFQDNA